VKSQLTREQVGTDINGDPIYGDSENFLDGVVRSVGETTMDLSNIINPEDINYYNQMSAMTESFMNVGIEETFTNYADVSLRQSGLAQFEQTLQEPWEFGEIDLKIETKEKSVVEVSWQEILEKDFKEFLSSAIPATSMFGVGNINKCSIIKFGPDGLIEIYPVDEGNPEDYIEIIPVSGDEDYIESIPVHEDIDFIETLPDQSDWFNFGPLIHDYPDLSYGTILVFSMQSIIDNSTTNILNGSRIIENDINVDTEEFNERYRKRYGEGYKKPYAPGTKVTDFETKSEEKFVRVYGEEGGRVREWLVKESDIKGLTPEQIKGKLALDYVPTKICDVFIPEGTKLRVGETSENFGEKGGVRQFEVLEEEIEKSWYKEERSLE
jgi:hypothetical protein